MARARPQHAAGVYLSLLVFICLSMQAMIDSLFTGACAASPPNAEATTAMPSFPDFDARSRSFDAAMDVLSGRFPGVKKALSHEEHWRASPELTKQLFAELKEQPTAVEAAKQREKQRKLAYLHTLTTGDGQCCREDPAWLEEKFDQLMEKANATALRMASAEQMTWRWTFEKASRDDRRYFAYKFQYAVYADLVDQAAGGAPRLVGGSELLDLSKRIFSDAAYCIRHIKNMVANGTIEPEPVGAPPSMPREVESVIFRLASKLRSHRLPVYKSLLIYHAQVAISGTLAALNFAKTDADGEYELDMDGGLMWDYNKFDNWVYKRFIGDRRAVRMLGVSNLLLSRP